MKRRAKRRVKRGHSKVHTFAIKVRMDRACSRSLAIREVRNSIHGGFYCDQMEDYDPGEFHVVSFNPIKAPR